VNTLYSDISELELLENVKMIFLIIRNLSFIKGNDHVILKCPKLVDIIISLFIDYHDQEITFYCLDIITALAKNITLSEVTLGKQLIRAIFSCLSKTKQMVIYDECFECVRRLSLSSGNNEYLEDIN
jgi:hypothetical protein